MGTSPSLFSCWKRGDTCLASFPAGYHPAVITSATGHCSPNRRESLFCIIKNRKREVKNKTILYFRGFFFRSLKRILSIGFPGIDQSIIFREKLFSGYPGSLQGQIKEGCEKERLKD